MYELIHSVHSSLQQILSQIHYVAGIVYIYMYVYIYVYIYGLS